jgi:hypothetical protein
MSGSNGDPAEWFGKLAEKYGRIKFPRGVVGKTSHAMIALLILWRSSRGGYPAIIWTPFWQLALSPLPFSFGGCARLSVLLNAILGKQCWMVRNFSTTTNSRFERKEIDLLLHLQPLIQGDRRRPKLPTIGRTDDGKVFAHQL